MSNRRPNPKRPDRTPAGCATIWTVLTGRATQREHQGGATVSGASVFAAMLIAAGASGCKQQTTSVELVINLADGSVPAPASLAITWLDHQKGLLRDYRVPKQGSLAHGMMPLASVRLEIP